jgi:hypothetical protein
MQHPRSVHRCWSSLLFQAVGWTYPEVGRANSRWQNVGSTASIGRVYGKYTYPLMIRRTQDGLRARVGGPWTRAKLDYIERYASAFMRAMNPKRQAGIWSELVYVDLLAGPGRGIDRDGNAEFDGSPLRALKIVPSFDRLSSVISISATWVRSGGEFPSIKSIESLCVWATATMWSRIARWPTNTALTEH